MSKLFLEDNESRALWNAAQLVPELRDHLFHIPNGGKRNKREAARMKGMGVRPGVSDYMLPIPRGMYHGLWIELKPDSKDRPQVKLSQRMWRDKMREQQYAAYIIKGWERAFHIMRLYLRLEPGEWMDVQKGDEIV